MWGIERRLKNKAQGKSTETLRFVIRHPVRRLPLKVGNENQARWMFVDAPRSVI